MQSLGCMESMLRRGHGERGGAAVAQPSRRVRLVVVAAWCLRRCQGFVGCCHPYRKRIVRPFFHSPQKRFCDPIATAPHDLHLHSIPPTLYYAILPLYYTRYYADC